MKTHRILVWCVLLLTPATVGAQTEQVQDAAPAAVWRLGDDRSLFAATPEPPSATPARFFAAQAQPAWLAEGRACEGCPKRRVGAAMWQTVIINGFYELANLVRGQVTAHITPKTWWANMEQGWVWDLDDFAVNQIGHPYQGSNYFNAGRANGLSFYESAAVTAFGSSTWEFYGETNHASLNDFINTTLGGIALGEMFHRAAWLVRDTHATGKSRLWNEIGATVIDPITGVNRFLSGDASRVSDKPPEMVPSDLRNFASFGALWRGTQDNAFDGDTQVFLELDAVYGRPDTGESRTPYDAFGVRLRFGGGSSFSEASVRGRLFGHPFKNDKLQFSIIQSYEYQSNDAYATGSQSFETALGWTHPFSSRTTMRVLGWGGFTVLGAVDSLPADLEEVPEEEEEEEEGGDAGQGVSEGPRFYDYGPGANFGTRASVSRDDRPFVVFFYEGRHLYSLDGVRANHFLQRGRLDLLLPIHGPLGFGVTGEYFDRRTYYKDAEPSKRSYHYPQLRAYFTWGLS